MDMAANCSGAMQVQAAKPQMNGGKIDMQLCMAAGMRLAGQAERKPAGCDCERNEPLSIHRDISVVMGADSTKRARTG